MGGITVAGPASHRPSRRERKASAEKAQKEMEEELEKNPSERKIDVYREHIASQIGYRLLLDLRLTIANQVPIAGETRGAYHRHSR